MNFTNITTYRRLKREEEKTRLLSTLNHSTHHEMLGPLRANVDVTEILIRLLDTSPELQSMAKTLMISSKLVMFHANDMLDMKFLQNGKFTPVFTKSSITQAIWEVVMLVRATLNETQLKINFQDFPLK